MSKLISALTWRYATKKFDPAKKISTVDFQELLDVARLAPSSYGLQPWKFVVIKNPETRKAIQPAAYGQPQITDASHLIVLSARTDVDAAFVKKYIASIAETRNVPIDKLKGFEDMMLTDISGRSKEQIIEWNKKQVYIALGMLLEAAALKGIDACPMEGFDPKKFDEMLNLRAQNTTATVLCALGYRATDDPAATQAKVRFATKEVVLEL